MGNIKQDNLYLYPLLHGSLAAKPCSAMGLEWGNCFMKVRMSHIGGRGVWPTDLSWHWELCRLSSNLMNLSMTYLILVSVPGPNPSFFHFWRLLVNLGVCWDRGLDLDLDQGLTITLGHRKDARSSQCWRRSFFWWSHERCIPCPEETQQDKIHPVLQFWHYKRFWDLVPSSKSTVSC